MNKTTLESLEEALERLEHIDGKYSWAHLLYEVREALAEPEITTLDVCGEVCARAKLCYGCGKALDEANAKLAEPYACEAGECPDKSLCAGAFQCLFKAEPVNQEPVAEVVLREQRVGFGRAEKRKDIKFLRDVEVGADLYAAPADAKSIRAEERQRCIEAIRKAHHKELCDVWDCIEVIKELE